MAEHSNIFPKKVIICYGASGHGKGLVDAMSEKRTPQKSSLV